MPGENKLPRCPKGEKRDKKTKKCVKVELPKKNTLKKKSPNKTNIKSRKNKSPIKSPLVVPLLSKIKPDISEYDYKFLRKTLGKIMNTDTNRAYINESPTHHMIVQLHRVVKFLQEDIDNIKEEYGTREYHFSLESAPIIIKELQKYVKYFKRKADKSGQLKVSDIEALFK